MQATLADTLAIETEGGQWLPDGSRRRTPGGVFFGLLRERVGPEGWRQIRGVSAVAAPPTPAQPLAWAEHAELARAALAHPGTATSAQITVVGRPHDVQIRDGLVIATVDGGDTMPALPRGVPDVGLVATTYKVCVGEEAWQRAERKLNSPHALLIATGYAVPNSKRASVTVLAKSVVAKPGQPGPQNAPMKIQLIGRPGEVSRQGLTVVAALTSQPTLYLPADLPEPPPVTHVVYMTEKQWQPIEAVGEPTTLMIEGFCFYDTTVKGPATLAQNVMIRTERPARPPRN